MTALRLFVTQGYYDTKITDIAQAVPMSTGLMFHYFASKEELPPDIFFVGFLQQLFAYAKSQPWVFQMFVLMGQVRRVGMPEDARKLALSVDQIEFSAEVIRQGQEQGIFHEGDPRLLSTMFWATVQGIMEEMALDESMEAPDPAWIVAMLKNIR